MSLHYRLRSSSCRNMHISNYTAQWTVYSVVLVDMSQPWIFSKRINHPWTTTSQYPSGYYSQERDSLTKSYFPPSRFSTIIPVKINFIIQIFCNLQFLINNKKFNSFTSLHFTLSHITSYAIIFFILHVRKGDSSVETHLKPHKVCTLALRIIRIFRIHEIDERVGG